MLKIPVDQQFMKYFTSQITFLSCSEACFVIWPCLNVLCCCFVIDCPLLSSCSDELHHEGIYKWEKTVWNSFLPCPWHWSGKFIKKSFVFWVRWEKQNCNQASLVYCAAGLLLWLKGINRWRVGTQRSVLQDLRQDWTLHEGLSKETQVGSSSYMETFLLL